MTDLPSIPEIKHPAPLHVQRINFTRDIADLIWWADTQLSLSVALNEVYRPKEMAEIYAERGIGIKDSLHCEGLAADLILYVGDVPQIDLGTYRLLGEKWKTYDPHNRWGGDFSRPDADHFERYPEVLVPITQPIKKGAPRADERESYV